MRRNITRFFILLIISFTVIYAVGFERYGEDFAFSAYSDEVTEVYLGGKPLGVEIGTEGVIIAGTSPVITSKGLINPLENADVKCGDILLSVGGIKVYKPSDISNALNDLKLNSVEIEVRRGQNLFKQKVNAVRDALTNEKKLGLSVRENVTGIGTLTYVKENGDFGALGHHVTDVATGLTSEINTGKIFDCDIIGATRAEKGKTGELIGFFDKNSKPIGLINKNNHFGIFGKYVDYTNDFSKIICASQSEIKHGKAYIYTCIEGDKPDYYTVDIIKTYQQSSASVKSMVISVTDKRLLEKTGGIVQGMSGSPVVQNGKLIGAVTHVFVNDATKGYAVYIDWMLQN